MLSSILVDIDVYKRQLIYGRTRVELPFEEGTVRRVSSGGLEWYVMDTLLTFDSRSSVWMR